MCIFRGTFEKRNIYVPCGAGYFRTANLSRTSDSSTGLNSAYMLIE